MFNSVLQMMWELAEQQSRANDGDADMSFEPIGLWLVRSDDQDWYSHTPVNSFTFARTGGDGVHDGLLLMDGEVTDESPVVMTVPGLAESVSGLKN